MNNQIKNFLLCLVATSSLGFLPLKAQADEYAFNQSIGKVYVYNVNVAFAENGVTLSTRIKTPSCPNQYHISGYITVTYTNDGGNASRTWQFDGADEEGKERFYSDFLPYRQIPGGTVHVDTSAECIYHGIRHGGIYLPF